MTLLMRAARMHEVGQPMRIDTVERPVAKATDVVVQVKSCGMVPNLGNVLANWPKWCPHLPLPKLPATFGLDPAGIVPEVGEQVIGIEPGDRVYISPVRSCGACPACLSGKRTQCNHFTFNGYFGFQSELQKLFDMYPNGGFCEYMAAPQYAIVEAAGQHHLPRGSKARISGHRFFGDQEGGPAGREEHGHKRGVGNTRPRRYLDCAGHGCAPSSAPDGTRNS